MRFFLFLFTFLTARIATCQTVYCQSLEDALEDSGAVKALVLRQPQGTLPSSWSRLRNVRAVHLSGIDEQFNLSDALQKIASLETVEELVLSKVNRTFLPSELTLLSHLKQFTISYSPGIDLPALLRQLSQLKALEQLELKTMNLVGLPVEIRLLHLRSLNLDDNEHLHLRKLFHTLRPMRLSELNLSSARFTHIPGSIRHLKGLRTLRLEMIHTDFDKTCSYRHLARLQLDTLDLQGNFFGSFAPSISKLKGLRYLEIDGNCIQDDMLLQLHQWLPQTVIHNEINC